MKKDCSVNKENPLNRAKAVKGGKKMKIYKLKLNNQIVLITKSYGKLYK